MAVIEAADLRRTYKTSTGTFRRRSLEVEAVRGVSFEVAEGELFGLLGPNGAGKTTTIKMLITLLLPTSGKASVLGFDVVKDARKVRERIGYVFGGDRGLYERLPAIDNLRYFAELYGVPPREQKQRIAELLDLVGLTPREGKGRGLLQRHATAAAHRARPHSRPARHLSRRAHDRRRPGRRARPPRDDRVADRGREDRAPDDALHVRGRRAL
jgi:ABC-2 type transport system ATP-binding protein